jgi:hypothetical protein
MLTLCAFKVRKNRWPRTRIGRIIDGMFRFAMITLAAAGVMMAAPARIAARSGGKRS